MLRYHSAAFTIAMQFKLQVVFEDMYAGHGQGLFSDWLGLAASPLLAQPDDPVLADARTEVHRVELDREGAKYPLRGIGDTAQKLWKPYSVLEYVADQRHPGWGHRVRVPYHEDLGALACTYPRQPLRQVFWSVPHIRDQCKSVLLHPDVARVTPPGGFDWTVAVHIRRGDAVTLGPTEHKRLLPMGFYVGLLNTTLAAIASLHPGASVAVFVMSESVDGTLIGTFGQPLAWETVPSCGALDLRCDLVHAWRWLTPTASVDCLASVDVVIGSISSFTRLARALSSNVFIMPDYWHAPKRMEVMRQYDNGDADQDTLGFIQPWKFGKWDLGGVPGVRYGTGDVGAPQTIDSQANTTAICSLAARRRRRRRHRGAGAAAGAVAGAGVGAGDGEAHAARGSTTPQRDNAAGIATADGVAAVSLARGVASSQRRLLQATPDTPAAASTRSLSAAASTAFGLRGSGGRARTRRTLAGGGRKRVGPMRAPEATSAGGPRGRRGPTAHARARTASEAGRLRGNGAKRALGPNATSGTAGTNKAHGGPRWVRGPSHGPGGATVPLGKPAPSVAWVPDECLGTWVTDAYTQTRIKTMLARWRQCRSEAAADKGGVAPSFYHGVAPHGRHGGQLEQPAAGSASASDAAA